MLTSTSMRWLVVAVAAAMLLAVAAACGTETIEVPGETVVVEKEVIKTVEVPGETVVVEKEVVKTVEVPGPERVVVKEVMVPGKKYVTDPTNGKVVSAPEYGGTLTYARKDMPVTADTYFGGMQVWFAAGVLEKLAMADWATPRDVYDFRNTYMPASVLKGQLAESWAIADDTTYVVKIRKGVHWHDKAPMNGRELNAKDIEYNYHRWLGLGSGYTEMSPHMGYSGSFINLPWESVTATDDWTVEFKLKTGPNPDAMTTILKAHGLFIHPPEVIEQYGDAQDWKNMVGTGPFEVTDWVEGSYLTFTKSPSHWGYDEKYPENRLPYIDELTGVLIPEGATRLAALRAGEVDFVGVVGATEIKDIDQILALRKTNPEIQLWEQSSRSETSLALNTQLGPTDDIDVRRALQMALDLKTLVNTYYSGYGDIIPQPTLSRNVLGYQTPFEEWPAEIQGYYTYDPAGAEALLDAAGYKRGADGIRFTTAMSLEPTNPAVGFFEALIPYWKEIGVEVEARIMDGAEIYDQMVDGSYEHAVTSYTQGADNTPSGMLRLSHSDSGYNEAVVSDPVYDGMVEAFEAATTLEERQRAAREAMMYAAEQHWFLWGAKIPRFSAASPWIIGYSGEYDLGTMRRHELAARLWIDSELKEQMGR